MRRRSFEFDGMRLHEYYFEQFEKGPKAFDPESALGKAIAAQYGNLDYCMKDPGLAGGKHGGKKGGKKGKGGGE